MINNKCDLGLTNNLKEKKMEIIDDCTIKYHANGSAIWSKGKMVNDKPHGYWEWFRINGTLKRSGYFEFGEPKGDWITYDNEGKLYKTTNRDK